MFIRRYGKLLLGLLFVFLVVEIVLIAPTVVQEGEKVVEFEEGLETDLTEVDQVMKGLYLVEGGVKKGWELWSEEARSLKQKESWALDKVKAHFFGEDGTRFVVTGREGEAFLKTKDMKVSGDVLIRSSNGYTFTTESVSYNAQLRQLSTQDDIEMLGPRDASGHSLSLWGTGLVAYLSNSLMEVPSNVRAEKTFEEMRRVNIKSQKAQFSGQSKLARFIGNVIIDFENMRITGPEAEFQYDSKNKIVESMYVAGGVRVSDQSKWATSQNVKVDFTKDKFTFRGNPRVVQDNDDLRGEEIIFLEGGKKVKVQGARALVDESHTENSN